MCVIINNIVSYLNEVQEGMICKTINLVRACGCMRLKMEKIGNWLYYIYICRYLKLGNEVLGSLGRDNNVTGSGCNETLVYSIVHEWQQRVVVAINVQQPHLLHFPIFPINHSFPMIMTWVLSFLYHHRPIINIYICHILVNT